MDIPLPEKDNPFPQGEEETQESDHTSDFPTEDYTNLSQEDNHKDVPQSPSDPPTSIPNSEPPNFNVAPPNQLAPRPHHDIPSSPHSHGMFAAGGLPNLNLPPPSAPHFSTPPPITHFSTPPPGFPPLNQPPPGMMHFSQPPPSIMHQLKRPPPPPILKDMPFILKTSTNVSVASTTQERYSPSRVTADDDEASATEGVDKGGAQGGKDDPAGKTQDTTTANTAAIKKPFKSVLKGRASLLGKAGAKKRLMAFSGKTSFNISKTSKVTAGSVLEENDEAEKSAKKPVIPVVKKKKEEKKSMIEHIREEETRIKEAIGLKQFNMPFNLYGPGLFPISKLLDNPEELAKFEEKAKGMPDRLAAYEQKEKKRQEEKERDKEKDRQREKEKRKERESGRSKDSESDKSKNNDRRNEEDNIKRKPKFIPKSWREFKSNNITFDDIQKLFREYQENRSRDHRRQSFVDDIEAKLMVPLRVKSKTRGVMDKEFPAHMISNTHTKPHITFSINPHNYKAHFLTRYEIKQHKSLESWSLMKEFWNSYSKFKLINEGDNSREWMDAWNLESICARADLRADAEKEKNPEDTDIAIKSRWDSDNEAEENASQSVERQRKSSHVIKKRSDNEESDKHKNAKNEKFSEGLTDEYDLFLKSLDGEKEEESKEKASKEIKVEDDCKDNETTNNNKDEEVSGENICKDQDSDVSVTVEPPNKDQSNKKKKNKKLKKEKKEAKKKKKKDEKKAKKKAKKAKKKLKEQKEKEIDSKMDEAPDIEIQKKEEGAIQTSPRRNASHEDMKYDDEQLSKYQDEKLDHSNDSRYANSVGESEKYSPHRNERPNHKDQLDNDEKQDSRNRRNYDDFYENKYTTSRGDSNSLDYESEESKNRYSKQKHSNPKDVYREKQRKDSISDSQKVYKEISNNLERCIRENEYDREYKETHHSRYDNKLRKNEMDHINNEKNNHDLGGTMLYISDSENDEYDDGYNKSISDRKERKLSDRSYKKDDQQYSERYYDEKDSRSSKRQDKPLRDVVTDKQDDRTDRHKTQMRKEKLPIAFKVSGTKYSGQQIKPSPGFSAEDEQDNVSEVSNADLEDQDSGKEDHVVGSLADTLRALRKVGTGSSDKKEIVDKNKDKNYQYKSKDSTGEYSYRSEEDSNKWKDKNHFQKTSGRSVDVRTEEQYNYERSQRGRSPEEYKRYQSNSPRERSPRQSSPRPSQIRKTRSPRRSQSPMRAVSPDERSRYSEKHHQSYKKSSDYENHYEDNRSKYYEDRSSTSKYQQFEESHHRGEENELGRSYDGPPGHNSYESYSMRNKNYAKERERSPGFIGDRNKLLSPDHPSRDHPSKDHSSRDHPSRDHPSREEYGRMDDRDRSPNMEKQKYKHSLSSDSGKFKSRSRENLSELSSKGYYSAEEDFKHSRNNNSDRKETQFNSGYSNTTTEINSNSEIKGSDRREPSSYFTKDFKEHERYESEIEEHPIRRERKLYDEREGSHDREYYRYKGDKNIDQKETYTSRSDYRSPETTCERRYREKDDAYYGPDKIERERTKVVNRSPVRKEVNLRRRSSDIDESGCSNSSNNHLNRNVKEQYESRDEYYDDYVSSPIKKERSAENRNQEKGSYNYHREDIRSSEMNHFDSKQSNSLEYDSKHRNFSPESSSRIRKNSYHEYSASPNRYEYIKSHTSLPESGSMKSRSPLREDSSSQNNISINIKESSPFTRSKSSPTHIRTTNKRSISPRLNSPPSKVQKSPRRISEFSSRCSRSPRSTRMYSPMKSHSPNRRISPSQKERSPNYELNSSRSKLSNKELVPVEVRSNSPRRMSISPQRRVSRSQYQLSRSPQRRISRSPQRRLSVSPQRLRSPYRKSRSPQSPSKRTPQSQYARISPHRLSPHRQYSRSPNRRQSRSPQRRLSKSPLERMSRSPQRRLSRSPQRMLSRSPQRRMSRSPQRRLSRSPQRKVSRSPQRRLSRSPQRRLSRSPQRRLSPHRVLSTSPNRKLSGSPNRRDSYSQEKELSRSPLRRSKSPETALRSPNLSVRSPLRVGEFKSISPINNTAKECSSTNISVDKGKHTSKNLTEITPPDEYETNGTKEHSKIPLPDDHGDHGSQEYTKVPLADNKERQSSIIHDTHEVPKPISNESNWAWDQEKKCWLPISSVVIDTNIQNENDNKVSCESKISLSESTIKIDADSTISDSELADHQESPVTPESSPSSPSSSSSSSPPDESPRRLTLDERLQQEHGVTVQEEKPSHPTISQLYKWGYPVQPSQVIQVGNMLEILPQLQTTNSQTSLIDQVTNSAKIIPSVSGEILSSAASSSNPSGIIGQQQNTVTSTANITIPSNLAFLDSSVDKAIISQALLTLNALNQENMKKYTQIDPQIQADEDLLTPDVNMIAREQLKQKRRELKERRRQEREARREKRRLKTLEIARREAIAAVATGEHPEGVVDDAEEEALRREAMFEIPNLGSPVPDYEVIDEDEEEKEEEARERRQKRYQPVPLPPAADKGILMSPSYRARDDYRHKNVKFADGILPGEGTSPSGGEEIHSPPPPIQSSQIKEKKLRKKRRVRIKMIKQYGAGTDEDYSPPPPPPGDPVFSVKLFPGFDHHYKATASGAAIIYTQPILLPGVGGLISIPGVPMVEHSLMDDTPLIGKEGVSSPSVVTMSPSGLVVPTPVTLKLPSGCDYNAETMQYIYTSSATQSTASTIVDTNLSKKK